MDTVHRFLGEKCLLIAKSVAKLGGCTGVSLESGLPIF